MKFEAMRNELRSLMSRRSSLRMRGVSDGMTCSERPASARWLLAAWFLLLSICLASPLLAAQDESKILREQATKLWEARVKGDWGTVYDCLSEEERSGLTKEKFIEARKAVGPWRYLHYKMGSVETSADMGWVKVQYSAEPVQFPGIEPRVTDRWEKWEKVAGKWTPLFHKRNDEFPQLPPSLRSLKEEKAVTARADKFWKARELNDYTAVYHLCAPSFRNQVSLDEWLTKKAQNLYLGHEILWAEVKGDRAMVRSIFEYRPDDPTLSKADPAKEVAMQNWIKVDGEWYLDVNLPAPQ